MWIQTFRKIELKTNQSGRVMAWPLRGLVCLVAVALVGCGTSETESSETNSSQTNSSQTNSSQTNSSQTSSGETSSDTNETGETGETGETEATTGESDTTDDTDDTDTTTAGPPDPGEGENPWSAEWVDVHSVIVRPEALTNSFIGSGNYSDHVEAFVDGAKAAGARAVYIEMRAVDPSGNNPEQTGHMYFPLEEDPALLAHDTFVSHVGEDFGAQDGAMMRQLVDAVHARGMQAYAWLPIFRDHEVHALGPPYVTEPDNLEPDFVSIFQSDVQGHELEVVRQVMSRLCLAGVHLDYMRYQSDTQPQEQAASVGFEALHGVPISEPASAGKGAPLWPEYLEYRAEGLRAFGAETRSVLDTIRPAELGAFLMPHSLKTTVASGYADEPWSGVDYDRMASLGLMLSPMIYWGHGDPGWTNDWMGFTQGILDNLVVHVAAHANVGALALPTYSMAYATDEIGIALGWARARGIGGVTVFYYGDWRNPQENQFDRLNTAVESAFGPAVYPQVSITSPANDGATWPMEQPLDVTAEVSGHDGTITDAWYRVDGGPWFAAEAGDSLAISGVAFDQLPGVAPGCHELTVLVRDELGRPGQDVRVLNLQ
ncbi:MAG: hypothetical protein ACPG4T_09680 [Nannocystaceae bacterium]